MYLNDATNDEIKQAVLKMGYIFNDDDCEDLRGSSFEGETIKEALNDYLSAYER